MNCLTVYNSEYGVSVPRSRGFVFYLKILFHFCDMPVEISESPTSTAAIVGLLLVVIQTAAVNTIVGDTEKLFYYRSAITCMNLSFVILIVPPQ